MKKTRIFKFLVSVCVILSFFSCTSLAKQTANLNINDNNVTNVTENGANVVIKANANAKTDPDGTITFTATNTGVFSINVSGSPAGYEGLELYYTLTNSKGEEVRLAAVYDSGKNKYMTITDTQYEDSTDIDVILQAGETYTLKLRNEGGCCYHTAQAQYVDDDAWSDNIPEEKEYTVKISLNEQANANKHYQSNISSREISARQSSTGNVEPINEDYEMTEESVEGSSSASATLKNSKKENVVDEYVVDTFEEVITDLLLAVGDGLISIMNAIFGEEVTITSLVYNLFDPVNPNFFDDSISWYGITKNVKDVVSNWYTIFTAIAVAVYIMVLLFIGVQILLHSTGAGMSKAKELLVKWLKGILVLIFIPYLIKYAFLINEAIVDMLREAGGVKKYSVGSHFGDSTEWSAEEIEFRSPEFVSKYTGNVVFGSDDATRGYLKKLGNYEQNLDLMRIMRAYAGVTKKIIYAIIWYILLGQLIVFIVQYYKRYFIIAFLFAMFPLVCIFNGISLAKGNPGKEIGNWLKEILTNIFVQTVHAIIYTIITGVCVSIVKEDMQSSATLNWLIIILAINFMSEGEKLLKKIISALGSTEGGAGHTGQGIKGVVSNAGKNISKAFGKID